MTETDVDTLVDRIAKELPNPSWAHAALSDLAARARAAETYRADRDEYDGLLGRKMEERDRLARRVTELEQEMAERDAADKEEQEFIDQQARRVTELEAALTQIVRQYDFDEEGDVQAYMLADRARAALAGDGGGA